MNEFQGKPLDYEDRIEDDLRSETYLFKNAPYVELFPIIMICLGIFLNYQGHIWWKEVLMTGGILATGIYFFFSWYLYNKGVYKKTELWISFLAGLLFPIGILGVWYKMMLWDGADQLLQVGIFGTVGLFGVSFLLFIFHLSDDRASVFYRNIIARLMIFAAILFRLFL